MLGRRGDFEGVVDWLAVLPKVVQTVGEFGGHFGWLSTVKEHQMFAIFSMLPVVI